MGSAGLGSARGDGGVRTGRAGAPTRGGRCSLAERGGKHTRTDPSTPGCARLGVVNPSQRDEVRRPP